jgi:hypothetical protein
VHEGEKAEVLGELVGLGEFLVVPLTLGTCGCTETGLGERVFDGNASAPKPRTWECSTQAFSLTVLAC